MPLTDGLGVSVSAKLRSAGYDVPRAFEDGGFETWLSALAESQPYLSEAQNLENRSLFLRVAAEIHEAVLGAEHEVVSSPIKWSLQCFVGALHAARADVITFNYDTLLERALTHQARRDWETGTQATGQHAIQDRPAVPMAGGMWGIGDARTFRLLKLHGSIDIFWVPDDRSGGTINRFPMGRRWMSEAVDPRLRDVRLPGRSPFIVPPSATKSAFYDNPLSRQLWREAAEALSLAEAVDIIGYSMPPTDLVVSNMLRQSLAGSTSSVDVVNLNPDPVLESLSSLGVDATRVRSRRGPGAFKDYVCELERSFRPLLGSRDVFDFAVAQDSELLVAVGENFAAPVVALHADTPDRGTTLLRVDKAVRPVSSGGTGEAAATAVRASALAGVADRTDRIVIDFGEGVLAHVLQLVQWGWQMRGHSNWIALVPSAVPWSELG
jgi:hypothetical protein